MADTFNSVTSGLVTSGTGSKVGIGTVAGATPAQKLTISIGATAAEYVFGQYAGTGGSGNTAKFQVGAGAGTTDWAGMVAKQVWGTSTNNQLGFFTANATTSTEKMTILSSGNVGVGTTAPAAKLDVQDVSHTAQPLVNENVDYGANQAASLSAHKLTANYGTGSTGNLSGLQISATYAGGSGNLRGLDVTVNSSAATGSPSVYAGVFTNGNSVTTLGRDKTGIGGSFVNMNSTVAGSVFDVSVLSPAAGPVKLITEFGPNFTVDSKGGTTRFAVNSSKKAPVIQMDAEAGSISLFGENATTNLDNPVPSTYRRFSQGNLGVFVGGSGSVGIGTSTPATKLDVNGTAKFGDLATANNRLIVNGNLAGQEALVVNQATSGTIADFRNAGVSKFFISNAGNVGIGNASPDANLNIGVNTGNYLFKMGGTHAGGGGITMMNGVPAGTASSSASPAFGAFLIYEDQDCGTGAGCVHNVNIGARDYADQWNGGTKIRFMTSDLAPTGTSGNQNAIERMAIDRNGNVGIGASPNASRFYMVNGVNKINLLSHVEGAGNSFMDVRNDMGTIFELNSTDHPVTTEFGPNYSMDYSSGETRFVMDDRYHAPHIRMDGEHGSISLYGENAQTGKLSGTIPVWRTMASQDRHVGVYVGPDGRVGVGTETPAAGNELDVNGNANISGNITVAGVTTKVWTVAPDYVFEKDYKLASLDHVEKYLDQNKHLPEIPSAKEIKEKGMDLAEMNLKLLKKVEELTLYAIEQKKRDQKQQQEIEELRVSLKNLNMKHHNSVN